MAEKKKQPERVLDIFDVLREIDKGNKSFYGTLTDEQKKAFVPLVVMRWLSGVNDSTGLSEYYLTLINECVNLDFWDLSKYPDLQWLLLAIVGPGQSIRHTWIPNSTKNSQTNKIDTILLQLYPSLNDTELSIVKKKLTEETFKELMEDLGSTDDEIKSTVKEFRKLKI